MYREIVKKSLDTFAIIKKKAKNRFLFILKGGINSINSIIRTFQKYLG